MLFVPLPKAIDTCQGKVPQVGFSPFKCPQGVPCAVKRACQAPVHVGMHREAELSPSNPQGPENK